MIIFGTQINLNEFKVVRGLLEDCHPYGHPPDLLQTIKALVFKEVYGLVVEL